MRTLAERSGKGSTIFSHDLNSMMDSTVHLHIYDPKLTTGKSLTAELEVETEADVAANPPN